MVSSSFDQTPSSGHLLRAWVFCPPHLSDGEISLFMFLFFMYTKILVFKNVKQRKRRRLKSACTCSISKGPDVRIPFFPKRPRKVLVFNHVLDLLAHGGNEENYPIHDEDGPEDWNIEKWDKS